MFCCRRTAAVCPSSCGNGALPPVSRRGRYGGNYVNVQLSINGYSTYYWESDRGAEIDFVIQREGKLIPIEVKSADNTKAKSLKVYMETYKPDYAIKLSAKNFGFEDGKKTVPLYAAFCI